MGILFRRHVPNLAREGVLTMVYLDLYEFLMTTTTENDDATSGHRSGTDSVDEFVIVGFGVGGELTV